MNDTATAKHCPTCICGRRAVVQGSAAPSPHGPGSITWTEHLLAWSVYAAEWGGSDQSAERINERGGFSYGELVLFLGREPKTWEPR